MRASPFVSILFLSFIAACVRVGFGRDNNYFSLLTHWDFCIQIREGKNPFCLFSVFFFFFPQHDSLSSWFVLGIVGAVYEVASPTKAAPLGQSGFESSYGMFPRHVKI